MDKKFMVHNFTNVVTLGDVKRQGKNDTTYGRPLLTYLNLLDFRLLIFGGFYQLDRTSSLYPLSSIRVRKEIDAIDLLQDILYALAILIFFHARKERNAIELEIISSGKY